MKVVEGTHPHRTHPYPRPAEGQRTAAARGTRDEKALPRSEPGIEEIDLNLLGYFLKLEDSLMLDETNWVVWRAHLIVKFRCCGIEGYANGTIPCPDRNVDPEGAENWSYNDAFMQHIILSNVTRSEDLNFLGCDSAHEMWKNIAEAHRTMGFKTLVALKNKLCRTTAREGDNIIGHLDKLKQYRNEMNFAAIGSETFKISDSSFNRIIAESLPWSWGSFTCNYFPLTDMDRDDLGTISSQRFIELIEAEYWRREQWDREYIRTHVIT